MSSRAAKNGPNYFNQSDSEDAVDWTTGPRNVPVTPAFGREKQEYQAKASSEKAKQDYFGLCPSLKGNVISATFTIPHILYRKGKQVERDTGHGFWQSGHFDCLSHLTNSRVTSQHIVVAWPGEIIQSGANSPPSSATPTPTSIAPDGHAQNNDDPNPDRVVFVSTEEQEQLETDLRQGREHIIPVWLCAATGRKENGIELQNQSRWRRYAEHDLYPLFHYKQREPTGGGDERARWNDYHFVSEAFANKICAVYKPGDTILVHDFYLMLLPGMLRQRLPSARIAFLLQTPFPTSEFVRCLPHRRELLEGVLGADLVAFQAPLYAEHFANSCARILQARGSGPEQVLYRGQRTQLAHIPTGFDIQQITQRAFHPDVDKLCEEVRDSFSGKRIILGHDPVSSLSGLDKKLLAYDRFLRDHPEWRGRVVLVQLTSPAALADAGAEEADFAARISLLVGDVNARHGSLGHTPVQLSPLPPRRDEYLALLRRSDVALVTSVRQGISTTALEYAACQRDDACGTLVLSELSGTAAGALGAAVVINPWDVATVADAIYDALTATREDRAARHEALRGQVQDMSVESWAAKLFGMLDRIPKKDDNHEAV
ncbi:trehalose-phosphatase [Cordyceps fumosorosea ARSEF 2679]|uniref:Trehalose-phosphatase n=1 Tax=Cordyceps fumosorosea (strain ARSEF 2679) TaxID=1081104 RepID=A0A167R036_CORFA|nr:trehalose-phosphatase [Cordyceps fumosorosea ARSEF 2679]OAA58146.1 trehalose-phosphatase [Cordyceps fumosorosea ARSEF 2679]